MWACLFIVNCGAVVQRSGMKSSGFSKDVSTTGIFVSSSTRKSVNDKTTAIEPWKVRA